MPLNEIRDLERLPLFSKDVINIISNFLPCVCRDKDDFIYYRDLRVQETLENIAYENYKRNPKSVQNLSFHFRDLRIYNEYYCTGDVEDILVVGTENIPLLVVEGSGSGCICLGIPPTKIVNVTKFSDWILNNSTNHFFEHLQYHVIPLDQ